MNSKQVIVIRRDLKMRRGKEIAQGAHASMAFLTKDLGWNSDFDTKEQWRFENLVAFDKNQAEAIIHWLKNSFRKIVVYVNSEQELDNLFNEANSRGLIVNMITDNGATEFNNVPTKTCVAIGPAWDKDFEGLTDNLALL